MSKAKLSAMYSKLEAMTETLDEIIEQAQEKLDGRSEKYLESEKADTDAERIYNMENARQYMDDVMSSLADTYEND